MKIQQRLARLERITQRGGDYWIARQVGEQDKFLVADLQGNHRREMTSAETARELSGKVVLLPMVGNGWTDYAIGLP